MMNPLEENLREMAQAIVFDEALLDAAVCDVHTLLSPHAQQWLSEHAVSDQPSPLARLLVSRAAVATILIRGAPIEAQAQHLLPLWVEAALKASEIEESLMDEDPQLRIAAKEMLMACLSCSDEEDGALSVEMFAAVAQRIEQIGRAALV